jgi:RNA polymerase sigma-70 factor (ECF subfamily)
VYREVVVLCDLEQCSYADAAARLECPVGTVRSRLNRARGLLLAKLGSRDTAASEGAAADEPARRRMRAGG